MENKLDEILNGEQACFNNDDIAWDCDECPIHAECDKARETLHPLKISEVVTVVKVLAKRKKDEISAKC